MHIQNIFEEKEAENVGVNDKNVGVNVGVKLNKTQIKIVELIRNNPSVTIEEMAKFADVATRTTELLVTLHSDDRTQSYTIPFFTFAGRIFGKNINNFSIKRQ